MAKRRVEDILYQESLKNKKRGKIKINSGINRGKVPLCHLDEISNYCIIGETFTGEKWRIFLYVTKFSQFFPDDYFSPAKFLVHFCTFL